MRILQMKLLVIAMALPLLTVFSAMAREVAIDMRLAF
jgi:hypothetical protein